jgi:pimeloyl-ACP methyl ester carboxylesterase
VPNRTILIFALIGLTVGCGTNSRTVCPLQLGLSPLELNDANGVETYALIPPNYDPSVPSRWVLFDHGLGQTGLDISTNPCDSVVVEALLKANYVVIASDYKIQDCWGNAQCVIDIAAVQKRWKEHLNLTPYPYVIAQSMGGIVTWNAISHSALSPRAVVGIFPACSLSNMYDNATGPFYLEIQSDYGFSSPSGYAAATAGYDPMLAPASDFTSFPILMWASYSDTVVVRSQNEDPFAAQVNAAGGHVVIKTSDGNHGDISNFDPQAVLDFFEKY